LKNLNYRNEFFSFVLYYARNFLGIWNSDPNHGIQYYQCTTAGRPHLCSHLLTLLFILLTVLAQQERNGVS